MRIRKILLLLSLCACAGACYAQMPRRDISVGAIGVFTLPSPGQFVYDGGVADRVMQSNRDGPGISMEYRRWWGNNSAGLQFSKSSTNSRLVNDSGQRLNSGKDNGNWLNPLGQFVPWSVMTWRIHRDEVDVLYTRRFRGRGLRPYLTAGLGAEVLNGGQDASGLDAQFAYVLGAGEDIRLSHRFGLRTGFTSDSIHAPTYGDRSYRSVRTWIFEPRFAITYSFDFNAPARPY